MHTVVGPYVNVGLWLETYTYGSSHAANKDNNNPEKTYFILTQIPELFSKMEKRITKMPTFAILI